MSFAAIFVPDFPVEAVLHLEPELRSRAVVVLEGKPPLQKIWGLNDNARRTGLEIDMTRLQAEPGQTWCCAAVLPCRNQPRTRLCLLALSPFRRAWKTQLATRSCWISRAWNRCSDHTPNSRAIWRGALLIWE